MKVVRRNLGLAADVKPKRLPEIISPAEADRLIARAYRRSPSHGLIVKFLWMTMVRVGELVRLEIPDIRTDEGHARIRGGKGGMERLVVVPTPLAQEVRSYVGNRRRGPLFVSTWRV